MWYGLGITIFLLSVHGIRARTVKVSVFYEALCPDSVEFIVQQLFPTYASIGEDIKVDLIPFGNAKVINRNGRLEFKCQHGPEECYGNKIHSCAIALYPVEESTEFVNCAMSSRDSSADENLERCANTFNISWDSLENCYTSGQADKLLEENAVRTENVKPAIKFIPAVVFNDYYNQTLENAALKDFMGVVCEFLDDEPIDCKRYNYSKIQVKLLI